jgi:hypothetical protein
LNPERNETERKIKKRLKMEKEKRKQDRMA